MPTAKIKTRPGIAPRGIGRPIGFLRERFGISAVSQFAVCLVIILSIAIVGLTPISAQAQLIPGFSSSEEPEGGSLEGFLEDAKKSGSTVIIVQPNNQTESQEDQMVMPTSSEQLLRARWQFRQIMKGAPDFFDGVEKAVLNSSTDGTMNWFFVAVLIAIAGIAAGWIAARFLQRWLRNHFAYVYDPEPKTRADKVSYLLFRALMIALQTMLFFGIAILFAIIFDTEHEPSRQTIFEIVTAFAAYRFARYVILLNFFAPDLGSHRMINLSDSEAKIVYRDWVVAIWLVVPIVAVVRWLMGLGFEQNNAKLLTIGALCLIASVLITLTIKHRHYITKVIVGPGDPDEKPQLLIYVAKSATFVVMVYLIAALAISVFRVTLNLQSTEHLIAAPLGVGLVALVIYAIAAVVIDRVYERRERRFRMLAEVEAEKDAWREMLEQLDADPDDGIPEPEVEKQAEYMPLFKPLFEHAAVIAILVFSVGETARIWGVDVGRVGGHPLTAFLDIVLVIYLAYLGYRAVNIWVNHKIVEEGGSLDDSPLDPGEGDVGGQGESRLVTLLPIFRNVMVITIFVIGSMIVLSQAGVNIGPLFAGAGVVGIAIGFGAQTLIRDIFSGAFYLIDDAFRKGEYIELDSIRGTVEKISIRSFQLRHHLGALHTIPFGEIHQLTNYSRDWVMMKLPLRVTYDTDVERVRKLVKKLGEELLKHAQVGSLFLQPLKSQGVIQMEDSAMIIRVKFMTKPGEQWVVRKVVYAAIRELFEKEGIKFAHKEVTVRVTGDKKVEELSSEDLEAVGAAARTSMDEAETLQPDMAEAR